MCDAIANTDYDADLWQMANRLRASMDAAEYKHVLLGLIVLKYNSDAFDEIRVLLEGERERCADPGAYCAENIFWVPPDARWKPSQKEGRRCRTLGFNGR